MNNYRFQTQNIFKSRLIRVLLLLIFCIPYKVFCQSTANYTFSSASNGSLSDMTSNTTQLIGGSEDDKASTVTNISFPFYFMGNTFTQFSVNSNGVLQLGSSAIAATFYSAAIVNTYLICPFARDLATSSTGKVHYKVTGNAPNRVLIIEWLNMEVDYSSSTSDAMYQARLYEGSGIIEFVYGSMAVGSGGLATSFSIGISSSNTNNKFSTVTTSTSTVTTSGTETTNTYTTNAIIADLNSTTNGSRKIYTFTPPSPTAPTNISFTAISVTSMTLNWTDAAAEYKYAIYNSTDGGSTWNFVTDAAAGSTSYSASGLSGGTTYNWRVYAVSEGGYSTALSGSQATNPCTMSGTKTIGASGDDYTTIQAAANALVSNGLSGAVVLEIQSDYNPAGETYPITLNDVPCASATNTITIRPAAGVVTPIELSGSTTTQTININGADYITINGLSGRKLLFRNTYATAGSCGSVIELSNNCTNITVTNCTIESNLSSSSKGLIMLNGTGLGNSNITITNNHFKNSTSGTAGNPYQAIYSNSTTNSNVTITGNDIYNWTNYGINGNSCGNSFTISNNNFYNNLATPPSTAQVSVTISGGETHTITGNYIGGQSSSCGGSAWSNSTTNTIKGIELNSSGNSHTISNNTIKNITLTGSGVYFYPISVLSAGNTGITNIESNTIQTLTINAASPNTSKFYGIWISSSTALVNVSSNTIGHASTSNSITNSGSGTTAGIYSNNENSASQFSKNTIANITLSHASATSINLYGLYAEAGDIKKNKIYKLSGCPSTWSYIYGIEIAVPSTAVTNECSNNMISLNGVSAQDHEIYGLRCSSGNHTIKYINNSILVYGSTAGGSNKNTYAFFRNNSSSNQNFSKNNIFISSRTKSGGTGKHYSASSLLSPFSSNYNFFAGIDLANMFQYGVSSSSVDWATWKSYNDDASSWYAQATTGASASINSLVSIDDLFTDYVNGDLSIKSPYSTVDWFINGKGIAGSTSNSIADDLSGTNVRSTTQGLATDIGADEFGTALDFGTSGTGSNIAPHTISLSGWALNTPQTFSFGGKNLATIEFTAGVVPTSIALKLYSGDNPANDLNSGLTGKHYSNAWWSITPTGGSGYTYNITVNYDEAWLGSITTESDILLAKWASPYDASTKWTTYTTTLNTTANTAKITGQTTFSKFTLADANTPLPVELLKFYGKKITKTDVQLNWTTTSETNNDYFEVYRSTDLINYNLINTIKGAGNSNQIINYEITDNLPIELKDLDLYYKLKQVDFDGNYKYSDVIFINGMISSDEGIINIYPKENNKIGVDLNTHNSGSGLVRLYDINGKLIYEQSFNFKEEYNSIVIPLNEISCSIYFIQVNCSGFSETKKYYHKY
ncbi:MAG: fibronectin type III domain-containing protein [Bacteroidota bacterium]